MLRERAVTVEPQVQVRNRLIEALPGVAGKHLVARCEAVDLVFGTILCEADDVIQHVYFPLSGFMSLVGVVRGHEPLELGLIGNEGMLGATLVLSTNSAPLRCIVQGSGSALRMDVAQFQRELQRSPALRLILNRYLYVLMSQLFQTATCVCFHDVEARLVRWLLMSHDRAHADHFRLTHQFLADMLGVRRSGVTTAAGALRRRGLIRYSRGEISIVDRAGLEAASCECYAAVIKDYTCLLHQPT